MKRLHGPVSGVTAGLLFGAAAGGACGGQAIGDYDDGAGAMTGMGPGGMAGLGGGGRGGSAGTGGRAGQGGSAMAGAGGRGGSAAGGRGGASIGGNAGVAGASMGGSSGAGSLGSCSSPVLLGPETGYYGGRIERSSENAFDACPGNGPEHVMLWTPPASGRYLIDTFGSAFDTVLYASSDLSCTPSAPNPQLECDDDFRPGSSGPSLLGVQALGGRDMLIVVDSYNSSGGDFTLRIRRESECPSVELDEQLGLAVYSTFEFTSDSLVLPAATSHDCRGGELGMSFVWRAPATGAYRFASGSGFPTVIALLERCEGALLACDSEGDVNNSSEITSSLVQGQEVVIEVTVSTPLPQLPWGPLALSIELL